MKEKLLLNFASKLARKLNDFSYDFNTYEYRDCVESEEEILDELTYCLFSKERNGIEIFLRGIILDKSKYAFRAYFLLIQVRAFGFLRKEL